MGSGLHGSCGGTRSPLRSAPDVDRFAIYAQAPEQDASTRSVVVGFDGSAAADRALERAAALAGANRRVVVVTARPTTAPSPLTEEPILDVLVVV